MPISTPSQMIDNAISVYERSGFTARFIVTTANVLKRLVDELGGAAEGFEKLKMSGGQDPVLYREREIVVCDLPSVYPIVIAGAVPDELELFDLKMRG